MSPGRSQGAAGRTVLVAGATSASGVAATRALVGSGAHVIAVGRDRARLDDFTAAVGETSATTLTTYACDLADEAAVGHLAAKLVDAGTRVDGILHLVGGWRGGGGLAAQSDADYRLLEQSFTALRHTTRAWWSDLQQSAAARVAIVSSTAVARPLAGGANYAAVKAASEAWMRAVAHGFVKAARDDGEPLRSAAVIFRVASLAGHEDTLARAFVELWDADALSINDTVIDLTTR